MTQTVILECTNGKKLKKDRRDCSSAMMGKAQKFSKGYTSGFVPDYRHAVDTGVESQEFDSSRHADSADSCAPKRKCISINVDQNNCFRVPIRVISTSKMSGLEKKDLEMKLKGDLEKVRAFQKKLLSRVALATGGVALSSSTEAHTKKQGIKRAMSDRFESTKQAPCPLSSNLVAVIMKQCETLLKNLLQHKYSYLFDKPVDVVKFNIPDYFTIIKHPMDLGTIKRKLASGSYPSALAFASDVRLTFTNAMTYNPPGNSVHIMADTLNKMFEKRWKPIGEKLAAAEEEVKRDKAVTKPEPKSLPKKRKTPPTEDGETRVKTQGVKPKISFDEKQELRNRLQSLLEDVPGHIVNFLKQHTPNANATDDEIEIDIESFSDDILFELRKLLDDHFGAKQSVSQKNYKRSEMEMLIESGVSNSSTHPCRVNEPDDEDVDIGGDDPLVSSYPPVEIEKYTAPRSNKCTSSSSSSSDSGSSSSDSESHSSSGSELDAKAAAPMKSVKENRKLGVGTDLENTVRMVDNGAVSGMDEYSANPEHIPVEANDSQEGENATSERQVSPDKLYRAALLRSRFADTILKAREKTLNQGEKKDPEKLRQEREELERQQREEKARIQAEAKAAETARKKAEAEAAAEAAAEAKRKRQLDREAARQALLQMEKTVEINESSLFLKDLEILGTAPVEDMHSPVHEMNTDLFKSLDGFHLGGSNPLEQLGLFMKDDDDEEEEGPPAINGVNDVEDGEID